MPFSRTLHGKLSLALLILLLLVGAFSVPLMLYAVRGYSEEVSQQLNRPLARDLARHLEEKNLLRADFASNNALQRAAKREISQLMILNPDIEIYVTDVRGRILAYSVKRELATQSIDLQPVQRFLSGAQLPILGDDPRQAGGRRVFSAARINGRGATLSGYVYIVLGSEAYQSVAGLTGRSYALRGVLWIMAGALLLVFGAGVGLFRVLTRRLQILEREMTAFGTQFAPGEPAATSRADDEIARLQGNFAELSQCVSLHVAARERAENSRRELMGNISHDLRTPLAALQGYLETLQMKDAVLSAPERQHYLGTALKRVARLNALIGSLFELAKLDAGEAQPQLEPFSLAELVQDETQQFALVAQNKGVQLQALPPAEDLPMVAGDIGLIGRALGNLLDNALRHTPAGGNVCVSLRRCQQNGRQCVQVQVSDNGEGIALADLPHIFERNFRVSQNNGGAGLGLAITKRILELHDETVEVQSELGQGTTFSFRLWAPQ